MEDVIGFTTHLTEPPPNARTRGVVSYHGRHEVKTLVDCHTHWMGGLLDSEVRVQPCVCHAISWRVHGPSQGIPLKASLKHSAQEMPWLPTDYPAESKHRIILYGRMVCSTFVRFKCTWVCLCLRGAARRNQCPACTPWWPAGICRWWTWSYSSRSKGMSDMFGGISTVSWCDREGFRFFCSSGRRNLERLSSVMEEVRGAELSIKGDVSAAKHLDRPYWVPRSAGAAMKDEAAWSDFASAMLVSY